MRELTDAEIQYLGDQGLGWLATVGADDYPRMVSVAFRHNPEAGAIDMAGHRLAEREPFRDVQRTGVAALVVDDVLAPQRPRAVEVCGDALTLEMGGKALGEDFDDQIIRLSPGRVMSWGVEPKAPAAAKQSLLRRPMAFFADIRPWVVLLTGLLAWLVAFLHSTRTREVLTGQVRGLWTMVIFVAAVIFTVVGLRSNQSHDYALVAAFAAVVASWFAMNLLTQSTTHNVGIIATVVAFATS